MKKLFALAIFSLCLEANASYECNITFFSKNKNPDQSKLELKQDKKNKELFSAEKNGYIFEILRNETDPNQIEKLILTEKASTQKSISSFMGWKADNPNRPFSTALLAGEDGGPQSGARMTCKTKP